MNSLNLRCLRTESSHKWTMEVHLRMSAVLTTFFITGVTALENVALGKPAVQETPNTAAHAGLCTDGYNDGVYYDNSACCMLTGRWWIVDLLHVYNISHVVIYRRTDGGYPNNVVVEGFLQYPPMCPGSGLECGRLARDLQPKENITCSTPVAMRYLRVSSTSASPCMCEVEAYGSFVRTISSGDCPRVRMTPHLEYKLTGAVATSTTATSSGACGIECVKGGNCTSFSYNSGTGECMFSSALLLNKDMVSGGNWVLYKPCF